MPPGFQTHSPACLFQFNQSIYPVKFLAREQRNVFNWDKLTIQPYALRLSCRAKALAAAGAFHFSPLSSTVKAGAMGLVPYAVLHHFYLPIFQWTSPKFLFRPLNLKLEYPRLCINISSRMSNLS